MIATNGIIHSDGGPDQPTAPPINDDVATNTDQYDSNAMIRKRIEDTTDDDDAASPANKRTRKSNDDSIDDNDNTNNMINAVDEEVDIDDSGVHHKLQPSLTPSRAALLVVAEDEFSVDEWRLGVPDALQCWCDTAAAPFASAVELAAHAASCKLANLVKAFENGRDFDTPEVSTLNRRLSTVTAKYINRFQWGVPRTPAQDFDPAAHHALAHAYQLMIRMPDACYFAMHPDAEVYAVRHHRTGNAPAAADTAGARRKTDEDTDNGVSLFNLSTDLLLLGAMVRERIVVNAVQFRFMLANMRASVTYLYGPSSKHIAMFDKLCVNVGGELMSDLHNIVWTPGTGHYFASPPMPQPPPEPAVGAMAVDDDGVADEPGSRVITFDDLRFVRRLKPIVDGPVRYDDFGVVQTMLRDLTPHRMLGRVEVRAALTQARAAMPPAPPAEHASAAEWRAYAAAQAALNSALQARLGDLEEAVDDVDAVLQHSEKSARFAWQQVDSRANPDAVPPSQRMMARVTTNGLVQSILGVAGLADVVLSQLDDLPPSDALAADVLCELGDYLCGLPYVTVAELRLYAFLRRQMAAVARVTMAMVRQWCATHQLSAAQLAEAKKLVVLQATRPGVERVKATQSNSLIIPLAPSLDECAPMAWPDVMQFLRALLQYGIVRVSDDGVGLVNVTDDDALTVGGNRSVAPGVAPRTRPTAREWRIVYDALRELSITPDDVRTFRSYRPRSEEVYGEAHPIFANQLIRHLGITQEQSVMDIGSGIGTVVMQLAAMTGCRVMGIEIRKVLHEIALSFKKALLQFAGERGWSGVGDISLVCGDATVLPELELMNNHPIRLQDVDVVFCNNYVFSVDLEDKIFTMLGQNLKRGAKVVVMKPYCPRYRPGSSRWQNHVLNYFKYPYEVASTAREAVSWTANAVSYFVYTYEPQLTDQTRDVPQPPKAEFAQLNAPR
jgi:SAM-dependent methyltransferase